MIETAIELTDGKIRGDEIQNIIKWGHAMLRAPVQLKSDVLPAIEAGAMAIHIPYAVTWAREQVHDHEGDVTQLDRISELPAWLEERRPSPSPTKHR